MIPYKVAESQDENGNTCELHHMRQIGRELLCQHRKHRRDSQGTEALGEGDKSRRSCGHSFPKRVPILWKINPSTYVIPRGVGATADEGSYQRVIRVARRLRYQYAIGCRLDQVVTSSVDHNLSTRNGLDSWALL